MIEKRNVGTNYLSYPQIRNFVTLPFQKYKIEYSHDIFKIINAFYNIIFSKPHQLFLNLHYDFGLKRFEIMHFFNTISMSSIPWVVTFETYLPRWGINTDFGLKYGVKLLANDSCKKLIAISQCTYNIQCKYLERFPEYRDVIIAKMCVIHPAQKLIVEKYDEKKLDNKFIAFTIVGALFFRKGGNEVLTVFEKLIHQGYPLRLNIISSLQYGDNASKTSIEDLLRAKKIIKKFPDNIFHYPRLSNKNVLEILNKTHVGLLPTYADTYGYSVLEAQASGCPVITTNVRALPEINNNQIGWMIDVPKDDLGEGIYKTEKERTKISKIIEEGLYETIKEIVENPQIIREKGLRCLDKIREFHSLETKTKEIESIYDQI